MSKILKGIGWVFKFFGVNFSTTWQNVSGLGWYLKDYAKYQRMSRKSSSKIASKLPMLALADKKATSGRLSGHYFHQDLLVAQKIFTHNPDKHVDIGSRTDGFVTHVASYREIEVLDIRETNVVIPNIRFVQADLMALDPKYIEYTDSLSCLHVIEHFGLGRYHDPIDPDGHLKGLENLAKMIKPNGKFYFSTPIGSERVNFNSHRVFNIATLVSLFEESYDIDDFCYVDDSGAIHRSVDYREGLVNNFGCHFGCGIFELTKK